ncbi:MAG TPA: response regulator [Patescibacteria group bacterium]|jgi:CheY-like chemotaxis protein|nr:response regulator [Patescibacteria group bacterium]
MSYQFQKITVLVVEDNQPMLEVTKALLLTFGVGNVVTAQNGEVGFKRFCEFNPDIVIADWMMKPMDGITLTKRVRTDPLSPNPYVPVILMTGFSEKRRVFQARDAGVTEFLVKPFNARDLYRRIAQLIERPRQFVRSEDFFGPDRRRGSSETYTGPLRRESDGLDNVAKVQEQQARAQAMLDEIRKGAGMEKGDRFDLAFVESKDHNEDE